MKRENANIDGDTAMGTMLKYGSEGAKQFYEMFVLKPEHSIAHKEGDIHIHDMDFLTLTTTCCQIDIEKLFKNGFGTGHGYLREPNDIHSYSALACIAIQSNQNDQHGGQSIPNFDYAMAQGVQKPMPSFTGKTL
jgi:ribonucleoside-triphosphate reductase